MKCVILYDPHQNRDPVVYLSCKHGPLTTKLSEARIFNTKEIASCFRNTSCSTLIKLSLHEVSDKKLFKARLAKT